MTAITFGDDAHDTIVDIVNRIPAGYLVCLIPDVEHPSAAYDVDRDHYFVKADDDGVTVEPIDENGNRKGEPILIPWDDSRLNRIHIY